LIAKLFKYTHVTTYIPTYLLTYIPGVVHASVGQKLL
jgi:hypothetical protein